MSDWPEMPPWNDPVPDEPAFVITHPFNEYRPRFGANNRHEGIDVRAQKGRSIKTMAGGVVVRSTAWDGTLIRMMNYGNHVAIVHNEGGYTSWYCHGDSIPARIQVGAIVEAGEEVLIAGATGNVSGAHLHLMVTHPTLGKTGYVFQRVVDPAPLITPRPLTLPPVILPPVLRIVTNQDVINSVYAVARTYQLGGWTLLVKSGFIDTIRARGGQFDLARLSTKPKEVDEIIWSAIVKQILGL